MLQIILFNKPFNVLSQFTDTEDMADNRETLKSYINISGYYPAGRLDRDSEGLMILVNNGKLQAQISNPEYKLGKTYLAQVEGIISSSAIKQLEKGLLLSDGITLPAKAKKVTEPKLWERNPPIRQRKDIPTSWIKMTIYEGRNRQVRRMLANVGFPVLRLVRIAIGDWQLENLASGEYKKISCKFPK